MLVPRRKRASRGTRAPARTRNKLVNYTGRISHTHVHCLCVASVGGVVAMLKRHPKTASFAHCAQGTIGKRKTIACTSLVTVVGVVVIVVVVVVVDAVYRRQTCPTLF